MDHSHSKDKKKKKTSIPSFVECKRQLELAKQAFLVGFSTFERDWNPIGDADDILYEDLRDVVKDFYMLQVNKAKRQL